jgi:dipeptidase D
MDIFMRISDLAPKEVFRIFSDIASIPHGSGNTKELADYCIKFAKQRKLRVYKDNGGNVMIFKPGTSGYENSAPVILQGHLDMVCEKTPECTLDMDKDGLILCTDGEFVWADGTTLGGDDGIAVAYILAVLDSDNISHPPIEALLTNDEEVGLKGANELDASELTGKRLINIDSEDEGILTVSCAGAVRASCSVPLGFEPVDDTRLTYKLSISGLLGGHSGMDIINDRRNAACLLGRLFFSLSREISFGLCALESGGRVNVIPSSAEAVICINKSDSAALIRLVDEFSKILGAECSSSEPNVTVSVCETKPYSLQTDKASTRTVIFALTQMPYGIFAMNPDIPGMVRTSVNPGLAVIEDNTLKIAFLIRSNIGSEKQMLLERVTSLFEYIGGDVLPEADYPEWEYMPVSPLRELMVQVFKEQYGRDAVISSIHAGLECGILSGKLGGADMVSFGPDLENVHTVQERMSVASVARCWEYLINVLKKLK